MRDSFPGNFASPRIIDIADAGNRKIELGFLIGEDSNKKKTHLLRMRVNMSID